MKYIYIILGLLLLVIITHHVIIPFILSYPFTILGVIGFGVLIAYELRKGL